MISSENDMVNIMTKRGLRYSMPLKKA